MSKELWGTISTNTAEFFYCIIALLFFLLGIKALKTIKGIKRFSTFLFWLLLSLTFAFGPHIPRWITGLSIVIIAFITGFNGIASATHDVPKPEETREHADKLGYAIFIPALILALGAFLVATFLPKLGANNAIGVSAILGVIAVLILTKTSPKNAIDDGLRLLDNVGTTGILPQLLAALGALFTVAGVGNVIATYVSKVIPAGSHLIAAAVYCIGMALFTVIMGNGFAAFSVITVGIGIPFLIMQGANPVVVGALGLTAGYCGTLLTPMAANFNIMPAALLETKDKYAIIKAQAPFALVMLLIHIVLLYTFAF